MSSARAGGTGRLRRLALAFAAAMAANAAAGQDEGTFAPPSAPASAQVSRDSRAPHSPVQEPFALEAPAAGMSAGGGSAAPVPEPTDYRMDEYRAPVPATLAGAHVIGFDEARTLLAAGAALFLDVYPRPPKPPNLPKGTLWRDPVHHTIPGAKWLPNTGYGALGDDAAAYFAAQLARLSRGNKDAPLVFFCQRNCWMSWNAARRALSLGYRQVMWFPGGTDDWLDWNEPLVRVEPER